MKRWFLALLLCSLLAAPASAAQPVSTERVLTREGKARAAAETLGFKHWGGNPRLLLQVHRRPAVLTAIVPATTSAAEADASLQQMAAELGWKDARLYRNTRGAWTVLQAQSADAAAPLGASQSSIRLPLDAVARPLAALTKQPAPVCVWLPGSTLANAPGEPAARGVVAGDTFLFYKPGSLPVQPLEVRYGISPRWLAAVCTALALALLFPVGAAIYCRRLAEKKTELPPAEQLGVYQRWTRAIRIATVAAAGFTFWGAGIGPARYLTGSMLLDMSAFGLLVMLWFWCELAAQLAAWPLQRRASPPGAQAFSLAFAAVILVVVAILMAPPLTGFSAVGTMSGFWGSAGIGLVIALTVGFLGLAVPIGVFLWRARRIAGKVEPLPVVPADPEGLRGSLHELEQRVARERAEQTAAGAPLAAGPPETNSLIDALQALDPEQQAALRAATSLTARSLQVASAFQIGGCLVTAILLGLQAWVTWRTSATQPSAGFGVMLLSLPVWFLISAVCRLVNWWQERLQLRADERVARQMENPWKLVDALRSLEEADRALQANIAGPRPRSQWTRRHEHLQKRLEKEPPQA